MQMQRNPRPVEASKTARKLLIALLLVIAAVTVAVFLQIASARTPFVTSYVEFFILMRHSLAVPLWMPTWPDKSGEIVAALTQADSPTFMQASLTLTGLAVICSLLSGLGCARVLRSKPLGSQVAGIVICAAIPVLLIGLYPAVRGRVLAKSFNNSEEVVICVGGGEQEESRAFSVGRKDESPTILCEEIPLHFPFSSRESPTRAIDLPLEEQTALITRMRRAGYFTLPWVMEPNGSLTHNWTTIGVVADTRTYFVSQSRPGQNENKFDPIRALLIDASRSDKVTFPRTSDDTN